jgi:DNA-binding NtrC family response regulator
VKHSDSILIVDDDIAYTEALGAVLNGDFEVVAASSLAEAKKRLSNGFAAVLLDIRLSKTDASNQDGLLLLRNLKQTHPATPVVMMTSYGDEDVATEAMKLGASDFVQKGQVNYRDLSLTVRNAIERTRWRQRAEELDQYIRQMQGWENLVGDHPSMHEVRKLVDMVAQDGFTNVLIRGETGTGKELLARAIHRRGRRKDQPFVTVPMINWPRDLVDAQLFGYKKGAFTGAGENRTGYLEEAKGGVLFLDEIGELPSEIQPKLLRVLENRSFARLGSTEEIAIDVQVVCATHRNLEEQIRKGNFREDLYYRLKTVEIVLPPLRERADDIPLLADHFLSEFRRQRGTKVIGITRPAIERLMGYSYPGNVRELRNIIDRAMQLATVRGDSMLQPEDFPLEVQRGRTPGIATSSSIDLGENGVDLDHELARVELAYITEALRSTEGKKTEAYRVLGLNDRFALRRRIKRIGEAYPHLIESFPTVKKLYYD